MAISTDSAVEFFGAQTSVGSSTASVADAAFSVTGDITDWTNSDDAPYASVILECAFGTAPDANSTVELYLRLMNIDGTNDQLTPSDSFPHVFAGYFPLSDTTSTQYIPIDINLPNTMSSQVYEFFIKNNGGQTISSGWDLHVTPKTIGPHA